MFCNMCDCKDCGIYEHEELIRAIERHDDLRSEIHRMVDAIFQLSSVAKAEGYDWSEQIAVFQSAQRNLQDQEKLFQTLVKQRDSLWRKNPYVTIDLTQELIERHFDKASPAIVPGWYYLPGAPYRRTIWDVRDALTGLGDTVYGPFKTYDECVIDATNKGAHDWRNIKFWALQGGDRGGDSGASPSYMSSIEGN